MPAGNDNTMGCADVELLLCEYLDGEFEGQQRDALEQHLAICPTCATLVEDAGAAVRFLGQASRVEPPDELITRLLYQAPTGRQKSPRMGFREWLVGWARPVLQPRLAMGMAMTILSFSLLSRFAGVPDRPLQASDLHPVRVWQQVNDRMHRTWDGIVKYYDNLRVVIEIQNRLNEWSVDAPEAGEETLVPPEAEVFPNSRTTVPEEVERSPEQ